MRPRFSPPHGGWEESRAHRDSGTQFIPSPRSRRGTPESKLLLEINCLFVRLFYYNISQTCSYSVHRILLYAWRCSSLPLLITTSSPTNLMWIHSHPLPLVVPPLLPCGMCQTCAMTCCSTCRPWEARCGGQSCEINAVKPRPRERQPLK